MFDSALRAAAAVALVCAGPSLAFAQDAPLAAGRPGFTESRGTVGRGVLQFEGGVTVGVDANEAHHRSITMPGGLVRVGVGDIAEIRVGGTGFTYGSDRVGTRRVSSQGGSDLFVGAKVVALDESSAGFALSVVPGLTIPTGSDGFTTGGYDPALTLAFGRALPLGLDATGVWSVAGATRETGHHADFASSLALARAVSARLTSFGEVVRIDPWHAAPAWSVNTGVAFLVNTDVQTDLQIGHGVHGGAGWVFSGGLIVRVH